MSTDTRFTTPSRIRRIGVLGLVLTLWAAGAIVVLSPADAAGETVTTFADLQSDLAAGDTVQLGADISQTGQNLYPPSDGGATLDLAGYTLTLSQLPYSSPAIAIGPDSTLTVEDTSADGSGVLDVTGGLFGAGIGGGGQSGSGTVIVDGGTVRATGGGAAAGIGGGAYAPDSAAASGGTLEVHGGNVTATGGQTAAGVGGGQGGQGVSVVVDGGTLTASSTSGPGIGNGATSNQPAGSLHVGSGGTVIASGDGSDAAIGTGHGVPDYPASGTGAAVTVDAGGTISASGPITFGSPSDADSGFTPNETGTFGSLSNAGTVSVTSGSTLTVPSGVTVDNSGTLAVDGTVTGPGTVDNTGAVLSGSSGTVDGDGQGNGNLLVAPNNYTLNLDANGGPAPSPSSLRVYAGSVSASQQSLPTPPAASGYTFLGWFTAASGGGQVTDDTDLPTSAGSDGPATETLYAHYEIAQVITFGTGPTSGTVGGSYQPSATGGGSGEPVVFSIDPSATAVCSYDSSSNTVTFTHPGTCVVDANQDGSGQYVAAQQAQRQTPVGKAATRTTVSVAAHMITSSVSSDSGSPSGTVTFAVGGSTVGHAPLRDGTATLAYTVSAGRTRTVSAGYGGNADYLASSASTSRADPTITARVTSADGRSRFGWFRTPVRVSFTCRTLGSSLTAPCPRAVTLSRSAGGQSVARTIRAHDGGVATVTVSPINIDRVLPRVRVAGVRSGARYAAFAPRATCAGSDALSGLSACTLTSRRRATANGYSMTYRATAADHAGNTASAVSAVTVATYYIADAAYSAAAFTIRRGHTYTLVAIGSGRRPVYVDAAPYPQRPHPQGSAFHRVSRNRWLLRVTFTDGLRSHRYWNIGIRKGDTLHVLTIRVVG